MIWVAVLGIMAIVGSILMLKPSARDSRLAKLRFEALRQGLQVKQFTWQPESKKTGIYQEVNATSYSFVRPNTNKIGALRFCIAGQKGWETEHLPEGFCWHKQGSAAEGELFSRLIKELGDELYLLEVHDNKAIMMVKEGPGASAQAYQHFLEQFL